MAQVDYEFNRDGNRSTTHTVTSDLPGAFSDKQGGLWFANSGYYVVVSGSSSLNEKVARIIVAKL